MLLIGALHPCRCEVLIPNVKHYILLSLQPPAKSSPLEADKWETSIAVLAHRAQSNKGIAMLGPHAWLIERDGGMSFVSECVVRAETHNATYKILFLVED